MRVLHGKHVPSTTTGRGCLTICEAWRWSLGLGIVRDLAELYGGSISLEDSPPGGLPARVTLAIYAPEAPEVPVPGVRVR